MESSSNGSNKQVIFKGYFHRLKKKILESKQKHQHRRCCSVISENAVPYSVNISISVCEYKTMSNSQLLKAFTAQYRPICVDENVVSSNV